MSVRTRFAPSPTGYMHVGGVRTALYAWLLAKQQDGQFILRIEDTDKAREVEGSIQHIIKSLAWLGIAADEGEGVGGPYAPYKQSDRLPVYLKYAQILIDKGLAYADPYTAEQLDELRARAKAEKRPFLFRDHRPENPPAWDGEKPLRFKVPEIKSYTWHDAVRGELSAGPEALDDFIIIKGDGFPTYNFAHIIDDFEMKVTHIMRADEFLASVPKYLALYEALEITPPIFVTLPPIMTPDGRKKLGKRDGAKDVLDYKTEGYLPEAMLNFLASMGWNDGTEQEIFTVDELIEKFSIERIQRGGAKFDPERLVWMNGQHIRRLSLDALYLTAEDFWPESAKDYDDTYKKAALGLIHERLKFFAELPELTEFFFTDPQVTSEAFTTSKQTKKLEATERQELLNAVTAELQNSDFSESDLENRLRELVGRLEAKPGALFGVVRIAVTGSSVSPGLFETMHVLGRDRTLRRLQTAARV